MKIAERKIERYYSFCIKRWMKLFLRVIECEDSETGLRHAREELQRCRDSDRVKGYDYKLLKKNLNLYR